MKFNKYLKVDSKSASQIIRCYKPWNKSNNHTVISLLLLLILGFIPIHPDSEILIFCISAITTFAFSVGIIYLVCHLMMYWYYISAVHYLNDKNNIQTPNKGEDKNE